MPSGHSAVLSLSQDAILLNLCIPVILWSEISECLVAPPVLRPVVAEIFALAFPLHAIGDSISHGDRVDS